MAHDSRCANAKTSQCKCGGCGGSLHGWPSALTLTGPDKAPEREARRAAADRAWVEAAAPRRLGQRLTRRKARAAIKAAKVDVIDWLSSSLTTPPSAAAEGESQLIQDLGDLVSTKVFAALCEAAGENQRKARAEFARNHLFCALLAATACAMQQVSDDLNKITTAVAGRLVTVLLLLAAGIADLDPAAVREPAVIVIGAVVAAHRVPSPAGTSPA